MRILVTGGAGFIGSNTVDALVNVDAGEIAVLDDLSAGKREQVNAKARFYQVNLCDAPAVQEVIARERPEVIYHLAAQMDVRRSVADPAFDAQVNLVGFLNLIEAARQHGLRRCVLSSTGGAIYGEQETFPTLEEALGSLGRVDAWPILVEPQLEGGSYTFNVRAGVRRGHLPASLRVMLFWTDDWARFSEWYTWSLPV